MHRLHRLFTVAALSVVLGGCVVAPYPYGTPAPAAPANFDRSWDAALGAAADVGVQVSSADRASGRIRGNKAGAAVAIDLLRQPDGSLQVSFGAPDSRESNPTLGDRWRESYQRRMGR